MEGNRRYLEFGSSSAHIFPGARGRGKEIVRAGRGYHKLTHKKGDLCRSPRSTVSPTASILIEGAANTSLRTSIWKTRVFGCLTRMVSGSSLVALMLHLEDSASF